MKKKILVVAGLLAMSGALTAQSVYPGQHAGKLKRETVAPMKVKSFDLKDVRLLPSRYPMRFVPPPGHSPDYPLFV